MELEHTLRLSGGLRSPGDARRSVSQVLGPHVARADVETTALLVSELVTNAVVHAGTVVDVHLSLRGQVLRVEVGDGDLRPPVLGRAVSEALSTGRGLRLLEVLASGWGVEPRQSPAGKVVWCELAVRPS